MKTATKLKTAIIILAAALLIAIVIIIVIVSRPGPVDPHEGQVYIDDGFDMVWITPLEGVAVNTISREDFRFVNGWPYYEGEDYETMRGIDVSEHQHEIDWAQVASAGIDFAMIRLGYRGYTQGGIFEDPYFKANVEGASENGIDVGVYFFSQAVTPEEALEEAEFVLERIKDYDISMPVVFDWEKIDGGDARTAGLDTEILDNCAIAFCEAVKSAGYEPCVYFNRYHGYYGFDISKLTDYKFWLAVPGSAPEFYYAFDMWQYTFTASIPGIEGETDMNLMFSPVVTETPAQEDGK